MKFIVRGFNVAILLFIVFWPGLQAQTFSERDRKEKTFHVDINTTIEINNKYGRIQVVPWDKDSVKFVVDINISTNNLSRLQKLRDNIKIDFTGSTYYITANTNFGSKGNQIFTELRSLSGSIIPGSNNIEINYMIYCPEKANINLINKFGDIYIDDLDGKVKISLSNGDLKINRLTSEAQIELNFGSGIINHLSEAIISSSYSDLNIKKADQIQIDSKSSTIRLNDVGSLRIISRRDKYFITNVNNLFGSGDFTQFWIENLRCEINTNHKFGNVSIDKIWPEFCSVNINSEFTDINLYIDKNAMYEADVYYHKDVSITFPASGMNDIEFNTVDKSEYELHTNFKKGKGNDLPRLKIMAAQKCFINILEK